MKSDQSAEISFGGMRDSNLIDEIIDQHDGK